MHKNDSNNRHRQCCNSGLSYSSVTHCVAAIVAYHIKAACRNEMVMVNDYHNTIEQHLNCTSYLKHT